MNYFELMQDDAALLALLKRIKQAVADAGPGVELDDFVILRKLPPAPGAPLVQFIEGVVPKGFNFYAGPGATRKHKTTTRNKKKLRKKFNRPRAA